MEPRNKEFRLQLYARAAAPCRDYYGLTINNETIVLNIWNISHGPHVYPKMSRNDLYDYPDNKRLQNDVERLFGTYVNEYIIQLANDKVALQCLPTRAFLCILDFLAKKDIIYLSQTSKIFFQLCQTDNVWKLLFNKMLRRKPSYYEEQDAIDRGWKIVLSSRLYRLRNLGTIPTIAKSGYLSQNKIKYNSLKLENEERGIFGKASGDSLKRVPSPKKATTKAEKFPLNLNLKNPIKKATIVKKPDVKISSTNIQKPVEEQYTTTLARRTLISTPRTKAQKYAQKSAKK